SWPTATAESLRSWTLWEPMHTTNAFIILLAVATLVAAFSRRLRIPYTIALVVVGLLLGTFGSLDAPPLDKELLFDIFLPGLLFEAAYHLKSNEFWRNKFAIIVLAVPGVIVSIGLTALLVLAAKSAGWLSAIGWRQALVFASLIAATDPVAVVALFRELGVARRLQVLVEGESLLNDGTSVVLFTLAVAIATGGPSQVPSPLGLLGKFVLMVGGGVIVGLLFALGVTWIMRRVDDAATEITLTMIAAYGSFALAESLGVSGVIATVAAGMLCGSYAERMAMSAATRDAVVGFWSYVSFMLNSIVFLLLGLQVHVRALAAAWLPILLAYLAVAIGRSIMIFGVSALLRPTRERLEEGWSFILMLGGLRGALSMVLALSLPADFPARTEIVTLTFGVVVISILLQGSATAIAVGRMTRRTAMREGLTTAGPSSVPLS
ncbi:MAG: cation:proton antiporter, partial [Gemmatimonadota bacterium]|nr:cation:proton antiporter [Gemmatimonadota bacterium]